MFVAACHGVQERAPGERKEVAGSSERGDNPVEKKPYQLPQITVLGTVSDLARAYRFNRYFDLANFDQGTDWNALLACAHSRRDSLVVCDACVGQHGYAT
jgi:hypothetical protein